MGWNYTAFHLISCSHSTSSTGFYSNGFFRLERLGFFYTCTYNTYTVIHTHTHMQTVFQCECSAQHSWQNVAWLWHCCVQIQLCYMMVVSFGKLLNVYELQFSLHLYWKINIFYFIRLWQELNELVCENT